MKHFRGLGTGTGSQLLQLLSERIFLTIIFILCKINIIKESLYVKSRSSGYNGNFFPHPDITSRLFCQFLKRHHIKILIRIQNVYQMMRNILHLFRCDFGRANIHTVSYTHLTLPTIA